VCREDVIEALSSFVINIRYPHGRSEITQDSTVLFITRAEDCLHFLAIGHSWQIKSYV
jgi:hypothetical protein